MTRIPRYYDKLFQQLTPGKVLVLYGPRQVGKTSLLRHAASKSSMRIKYDTGDDYRMEEIWNSRDTALLQDYVSGYDLIVIDEAQRIRGIGMGLKILVDAEVPTRFIVTGSSSFELAGQIGEPLTGRKKTLMLFPIAQIELATLHNRVELRNLLEDILVYGSYPEVVSAKSSRVKRELLDEICGSYLLKDILELERVKSAKLLLDLLRLLAYQVGSLVSLNELGKTLGIDTKTVIRYVDLLEKTFILYNVRGYSGNLRKEITKKSKYYFYDTGIRNSLIANFNPLNKRNDVGELWENFFFIERLKKASYTNIFRNVFFWRTWDGQEIDLVEEREGTLFGYECKFSDNATFPPKDWSRSYPNAEYLGIHRDNYLYFVS